jgi:hypothetical protein
MNRTGNYENLVAARGATFRASHDDFGTSSDALRGPRQQAQLPRFRDRSADMSAGYVGCE